MTSGNSSSGATSSSGDSVGGAEAGAAASQAGSTGGIEAGAPGDDASGPGPSVDGTAPSDEGGTGPVADASGAEGGVATPTSNRADVLLDDGWRFVKMDVAGASATTFDDSSWTALTLPHTWNVNDASMATYYQGPGWYRRHYTVPSTYAGRKLFLQFDAANKVADVYVNGTHVGQHRGGNAAFRFDVTSLVKVGADNVIAVKADNSAFPDVPPLAPSSAGPDFTQFGGLYRDAHLLVTDPVHVDVLDYASSGVFITPSQVSAASANLDVRVELVNDDTAAHTVNVAMNLLDASGAVVQSVNKMQILAPTAGGPNTPLTLSTAVHAPHLWNGRVDPYLYTVQVTVSEGSVVRDAVAQAIGFRYFALDPNSGFSLNGKYLDLHGVNRHQERQGLGWALTNKEHDEDMALIEELGANIVRLCHYQQAQHFHDLADRDGMILWSELGIVHLFTASAAFTQNATQQLTELIRQNYNHPSILFWSLSNELVGSGLETLMTSLNALAHKEDPTRLTTLADNASAFDNKGKIPDTVGFNYYGGWYSGVATDVGPFLDSLHQAGRTFGMSEFGAGANITLHSDAPAKMDYTEEYQSYLHETYWAALSARPYIWGKMVWSMFDFPSSYRAGNSREQGINNKGLMTHDHQTRKDAFYFFKASWSTTPFVYVTSRRFEPRTVATTNIKVYSNTSSVALKLNGQTLGSKTSNNHIFTWSGVTLTKGANKVDAVGTQGGSTVTDSVTWTLN